MQVKMAWPVASDYKELFRFKALIFKHLLMCISSNLAVFFLCLFLSVVVFLLRSVSSW